MKKLILAIIFILAFFTGCSTAEEKTAENYILKINNISVSPEEFNIYLYETQKSFEELGGEDIWETDFDGRSAETVAKENTLATIKLVKLASERAAKINITLSDEEKARAAETADNMYAELSDEQRQAIGAGSELYMRVFEENEIYNRVYQETVKNYVVSSDDFAEYYSSNRDTLESQYKELVNSEEPVNEEALRDYSLANYEEYMKQLYFSKEYEKWENTAVIETNDDLWNSIKLIK